MFTSLNMCYCFNPEAGPKGGAFEMKKLGAAVITDLVIGLALVAIGIAATQFGALPSLPSHIQWALLGAGTAYSFGILCASGFVVKMVCNATKNQ